VVLLELVLLVAVKALRSRVGPPFPFFGLLP